MLSAFALVLLFHLLWYLIGRPITRLRVRLGWDPAYRPGAETRRAVRWGSGVHRMLPMIALLPALFVWPPDQFATPGGLPAFGAALLFYLPPFLGAQWLLLREEARLERQLAGDPNPAHVRLTMRAACGPGLLIVLIAVIVLLGWSGVERGMVFFGFLFPFGYRLLESRGIAPSGRRSSRLLMPESPLRSEILIFLRKVDQKERPLSVAPDTDGNDPFKRRAFEIQDGWGKKPVLLPLSLLIHLDPRSYTALLARETAVSAIAGKGPLIAAGCLAYFMGFLVALLLAVSLGVRWNWMEIPLAIWLGSVLWILLYQVMKSRSYDRDCCRDAFLNWHDAAPEEERTIPEFVAALAQAEAVRQCIADPEVVRHRLRSDQGLMQFLDGCGANVKAEALESAAPRLEGGPIGCLP